MTVSRFEKLVTDEVLRLGQAALEIPLGDSHRLALLKGQAIGLQQSREFYKRAVRIDDEDTL